MSHLSNIVLISFAAFCAACAPQGVQEPVSSEYSAEVAEPAQAYPASPKEVANDVLFRALGLVGTPYTYGGNTPQTGFDCSGLIGFVFAEAAGVRLPRTTAAMWNTKNPTIDRHQLNSGDVVFFATSGGRRVSHAGIYVGEGRFVHAPSTGGTVRLDSLDSPYWKKAYLQAKRFIPEQSIALNP